MLLYLEMCCFKILDFHSQNEAGDSAVKWSVDTFSRVINTFSHVANYLSNYIIFINNFFQAAEPRRRSCLFQIDFPYDHHSARKVKEC